MERSHIKLGNLIRAAWDGAIEQGKTAPGAAFLLGFFQSLQNQCRQLNDEDLRNLGELAQNTHMYRIQDALADVLCQSDNQKKDIEALAYAFVLHVAKNGGIPQTLEELKVQMEQLRATLDRVFDNTETIRNILTTDSEAIRQTREMTQYLVSASGGMALRQSANADMAIERHAQIDKARDFLLKKKPDVTIALLEELRSTSWDELTPRGKYRLEANIGYAYIQKGEDLSGAKHFLKAASYQPADAKARCLEMEARVIMRESEAAQRLSDASYMMYPQDAEVVAWWVRTRPPSDRRETIEATIEAHMRTDFDVAVALAQRAQMEGDLDSSERHARSAIDSRPDEPFPHLVLGHALFERERRAWIHSASDAVKPTRGLEEAIRTLSRAFDLCEGLQRVDFRANILLVRGASFKLSGRDREAEEDITHAYALLPENSEARYNYALMEAEKKNFSRAADVLFGIPTPRTAIQNILLADVLNKRSHPDDATKALALIEETFREWDALSERDRFRLTEVTLETHTRSHGVQTALSFLSSPQLRSLPAFRRLSYRAVVELQASMREEAAKTVEEALCLLEDKVAPDCVIRLAYVCHALGRNKEAFDLLSSMERPLSMDTPMAILLDSGVKCGKEDFVLDLCSQLRKAHVYDLTAIDIELATLLKYNDYPAAIQATEDILVNASDIRCKKFARVRRLDIGMALDRTDLMDTDPNLLPSVSEATPASGRVVARGLIRGPKPELGVKYAYQLYRRFPNDFHACAAVFESLSPFSEAHIAVTDPPQAGPGTAVTYLDEGAATERVCIIEESADYNMNLDEYPPNHMVAAALTGKRVGEKCELGAGITAIVRGITDKYVYRWRRCSAEMAVKYPTQAMVWTYSIEGDPNLARMVSVIEKHDANVESALKIYRGNIVPASCLAAALGRNTFETVEVLSQSRGCLIRSCNGSQDEIDAAFQGLAEARCLVLDATTLATLFVADSYRRAFEWPIEMIVSQGTLEEIRHASSDLNANVSKQLILIRAGDVKRPAIVAVEGAQDRQRRLAEFLAAIKLKCRIESGKSLADVTTDIRDKLVNLFGRPTAETMALARRQGRLMWVDDLAVAAVGRQEMNISTAWTQIVFQFARFKLKGDVESYFKVTYELLQRGYTHTLIDPSIIIEAVRRANCMPSQEPLLSTLDQLANKNVPPVKLGVLAGLVIPFVWRSTPWEHLARYTTVTILQRLDSLPNGRDIIKALAYSLDFSFFGDAANATKAKRVFETYLRGENRFIVP